MRRLRAPTPRRFDQLLAALALGVGGAEVLAVVDGPGLAVAVVTTVVMASTLAVRRRAPLPGLAVFLTAAVMMAHVVGESAEIAAPFGMVLLWSYTLGGSAALRTGLLGLAMTMVGIAGVAVAWGDAIVGAFLFPMGFATAAWGAGRAIRHRTRLTMELHEAAVRAEEQREADAAQAVADERRRIAREMHDVVAHSVSVMVVQAGGARRILERDPDRAVEAAGLIERTGRQALAEMRHLLGVLGSGDEPPASLPQPTLDDLEGLVERGRRAGLPATLRVQGAPQPLPAGAEAAVYRVVQEALTNVLKHAGGAPADVLLRWEDDGLRMTVADRGRTGPATELPAGGHGIIGMRERMRTYGGDVVARPADDGGFVVEARLPLRQGELQPA